MPDQVVHETKIVYIAHPIGGNVDENIADLFRIIKKINLESPDVVPCAPYIGDVMSMDDSNVNYRKRGIFNDTTLILSGVFQELWLTGDTLSFGMAEEIKLFKLLGKNIVNYIGKL